MVKTIYFDESGFTGYNYLDSKQPIFTLASHDLTPELSEELLKQSFPKYRGDEFKFTTLWKSSKKQFLDLSRRLEPHGESVRFWVIDKYFAVIVKMVDFLVEPSVTQAGYNFLANGFGRKYANYIYFGLANFATPGTMDNMVNSYQLFSRNPSKEALNIFIKTMKDNYNRQSPKMRTVLREMIQGAVDFEKYTDLETFRSTNDLQFTAMLASIADWQRNYQGDKVIIHDASSNFLRQRDIWANVTGGEVEAHLHPLGDGTFVPFPLNVISTQAVNSQDNFSVQLADLLAGFASRHFNPARPKEEREILDGMVDAGLSSTSFNGIRPALEFPSGPPEKLVGPDAVDIMIKMMSGK